MPLEPTESAPQFEDTQPVPPQFEETAPASASHAASAPAWEDTQPLDQYGTPEQQTLAGVEGALRGGSLGISDLAETKLLGINPAEIRARRDANPWTSNLAAMGGGALTAALTGGGSLAAEGLGGGALAGAVGLGTEGAMFGAGNALSDYALGDPDLNAQKVMSHIGFGALMGAGFGAIFGKLGAFDTPVTSTLAKEAPEIADEAAPLMGYDTPKEAGPVKDYEDLQNRINQAQAKGLTFELPQMKVLIEAASRLPDLELPPLPQQIEALSSKGHLDDYRITFREGDSDVARGVQNYEGGQKAELTSKTDQAIESLSPGVKPTTDEVQGGLRANEAFTEQYQEEKKALKPMFRALDRIDLGPLRADIVPLMETLAEKIPSVARMFEYGEDGIVKSVAEFDPKWGLSRAAYNAVKGVFESLEEGAEEPASFQDLVNLRGSMDEHVNVLAQDEGAAQIRGLKGAFMDYLQNLADDHIPDLNLRDTFKRWAINEQNRRIVERAFGASVGAQDLNTMPRNAAEDILGKIFRNSETVKAAKRLLPPQKFDELLASHLAIVRNKLTKNGVFSSNRFLNYLRQHAPELQEAFSHRPDILQRLRDLTTISTIIPDSASINPSGSAKTFMGLMKNLSIGDLGIGVLSPKVLMGIIGKRAFDMLKDAHAEKSAVQQFNAGLMGKAAKQQGLQATQKLLDAVNANLDRGARSIFSRKDANAQ